MRAAVYRYRYRVSPVAARLPLSGSKVCKGPPAVPSLTLSSQWRPIAVAANSAFGRPATERVILWNNSNRWFSSGNDDNGGKPASKDENKNENENTTDPSLGETDPDTATGVNQTILMNPKGYSRLILPGNYAMKKNPRTGVQRKIFAERVLGYFWMMKDLDVTKEKPILGNPSCIEAQVAERFPALGGEERGASGDASPVTLTDEMAQLPDYIYRNNRAMDATAQCTLLALSYKDFGYKMLPTWIEPFKEALCGPDSNRKNRVEVMKLGIQEGRILRMLNSVVKTGFRKEIPLEDHERTLLYFGNDQNFKDVLRIHNTLTGYVFLLDGIGRIRWAGSGKATDEELQVLIEAAKKLTPISTNAGGESSNKRGNKGHNGGGRRGNQQQQTRRPQ